jgi:hypothetical protein
MASGSYFLILKETNNILSKEELDKLNDLNAEKDFWSDTDTKRIDCLQNTQPIRVSDDEPVTSYYSVATGKIYDIVCEFNFLSDFLCLKEHFEMNPWTKSGEITFSTFDIYKMLEILLYIKNPDLWSHTLESSILSNNEFLHVFDELNLNFMNRFDKSAEWNTEYDYALNRLIECFSMYLSVINNLTDKFILVYKTW